MSKYEAAAVKTQQSLSYLNLGQSMIFTAGMTAAMVITAQQAGRGEARAGLSLQGRWWCWQQLRWQHALPVPAQQYRGFGCSWSALMEYRLV